MHSLIHSVIHWATHSNVYFSLCKFRLPALEKACEPSAQQTNKAFAFECASVGVHERRKRILLVMTMIKEACVFMFYFCIGVPTYATHLLLLRRETQVGEGSEREKKLLTSCETSFQRLDVVHQISEEWMQGFPQLKPWLRNRGKTASYAWVENERGSGEKISLSLLKYYQKVWLLPFVGLGGRVRMCTVPVSFLRLGDDDNFF